MRKAKFCTVSAVRRHRVRAGQVPDEMLVERVVGRRSDPDTGAIYHLKFRPPPPEVADRLVQRSDDTEKMVVNRLQTYHSNVDSVLGYYKDIVVEVPPPPPFFGSRIREERLTGLPLDRLCR